MLEIASEVNLRPTTDEVWMATKFNTIMRSAILKSVCPRGTASSRTHCSISFCDDEGESACPHLRQRMSHQTLTCFPEQTSAPLYAPSFAFRSFISGCR